MLAPTASAQPAELPITVTGGFDKASYAVGDKITVTLTVTNTSQEPVPGVRLFQPYYTSNSSFILPQDGSLDFDLDAGATKKFTLDRTVHQDSYDAGYVDLAVQVLQVLDSGDSLGGPELFLDAPVPGRSGELTALVYHDKNGSGTTDDADTLLDSALVKLVGRDGTFTATTVGGRFSIADVPAGRYKVTVGDDEWRVESPADGTDFVKHHVTATGSVELTIRVVGLDGPVARPVPGPGPDSGSGPGPGPVTGAAPPATGPAAEAPAPQAKAADGDLPATGANVTWLALAGLAAIALGAGAVVVTRRRSRA